MSIATASASGGPVVSVIPARGWGRARTGAALGYWLSGLVWGALLLGLWAVFPQRIGVVRLQRPSGTNEVRLPWFGHKQPGVFRFEAELLAPVPSLSLRADDCVELLDVDGISSFTTVCGGCLHCAYNALLLPSDLTLGRHTLLFTVRNLGGEAWFDLREAHGFTGRRVLALCLWGLAAFTLVARMGFRTWVGWPVALAGLLALQYLEVTTPWVRQHDVEGHREYLEHLGTTGTLPAVMQGWETWQPPLYYVLAAGWRWLFSPEAGDDPFRPVQYLGTLLYLAAITVSVPVFRRLRLDSVEAMAALAFLAVLPGYLFFSARINNDTLLPVLGAGVLLVTAEFVRTGERRWLRWLAGLLPLILATKGSSLAIAGGALLLVFAAEARRAGGRTALIRAYFCGLPAGLWLLFWWLRNYDQTGNPLYVNADISEDLRIFRPAWERLLSFDLGAYAGGRHYYDEEMRRSYPTALVTSLLYGEYTLSDFGFRWSELLRYGCLGMLLPLLAGALVRPRAELHALWLTAVGLSACQAAITVAYAVQFPFACNQNMRFWAQAFVPLACLWGLGVGYFWGLPRRIGQALLAILAGAFLLGLGEFYFRMLL
jgi:hypothetical protein